MKINNGFFLFMMVMTCGVTTMYGMHKTGEDQKETPLQPGNYGQTAVYQPYSQVPYTVMNQGYSRNYDTSSGTSVVQDTPEVRKNLKREMLDLQLKMIEMQKQLVSVMEQFKDYCPKHEMNSLLLQNQLLCKSIEKLEKEFAQLRDQKPQVFNINTSGGNATSSSNPTITTTQDTNVKVENKFKFEWDSKMQVRCAVLTAALLFGLGLGGPEGGGFAFLVAAAMLYGVHTIQNKIQTMSTLILMTVGSGMAMLQCKDKELTKASAGLFIMSFCGTVLVGVLTE